MKIGEMKPTYRGLLRPVIMRECSFLGWSKLQKTKKLAVFLENPRTEFAGI